jgi:sacsin
MLAYKCGAKELRNADLTSISKPIGQPFGQHEELTDRLKNILNAYPADEGILKELLQNADDAKANEIHFVFDPRTHGNKHVFSPNWKDLQGPAICVYNDKPFTKEDIEGIQKLGIGSKVDDPMKTGQYGIGFNAVYHLTDCPYFISDDEVICVSDPHTAYVPGADEKKPGRLFNQLTKRFRRNYEDVLSGFLGDRFKLERSTMFRFPLRRNAQLSKISTEEWNDRKVKKLFETFRHSAKDMLLFLNNVTKISVSEIKRDGELETYSVMCEVSDEGKRAELFEKIKACSRVPTQGIQWQQIHYVMKITDTTNVKKDWLVTQSLGHAAGDGNSQVPDGTKMGLLPRAGIAIRLPSSESESSRAPFRHFVFCVLPLPVYTKFPAHINGHFALDQARRGVWHDPKSSDERVVWNDFMKRHVIAPAYASAICHAREFIPGHQTVSYTSGVFPTKKETEDGLRWYHQLFPSITGLDAEWKPVGEALFKDFLSILPVLPVALSVPAWKKHHEEIASRSTNAEAERDQTPVVVTWCDANNACFCTSGMSWLLEKTLVEIEFWLLSHTPWPIHESFKAVERCQEVSPVKVRDFLRNHRGINNRLPSDVKDTALHDVDSVNELTLYCVKAEDFFESLEGLPLLVTQDGVLRRFRTNLLVFCSRFGKLLPSRPDLFLHDRLRYRYDSDIEKCCGVVREFLLPDLAKFQAILFPSSWINTASHQPWNPNEEDNTFPSKTWLKLLWEFVDFVSKKSENKDEKKTSEILQEIVSWHIIPTTQNCLVPVSMSKTVLNVSTYLNSDSPQDKILRELLVKLGCPQLNHTLLISSSSRIPSPTGATAVRKHYLAMVQSTEDVLGLLHQTVNGDMREEATLTIHEIERLLVFLQGDFERLSRSLLRNLPFYRTISTTYTRLSGNHAVFEVEDSVPKDDLQILSTVTNSIFLSSAPKLTDLYRHIGIKRASSVEFYMRVVLMYFNHLTPEGRVNHLMFVRDYLLHKYRDGYQALLSKMIQLPFIPDHSGVLRPAKEFYDTSNEVFAKFIIQEKFPPPPFDSAEWKEFLKIVGLQCDVTQEHFFTFATQLQEEACNPTSIQAAEIFQKSNILVLNLSANECLHALQFLSRISEIRFVRAASMIQFCLDIHPSYTTSILTCFRGSVVDSPENRALVWTSASLIPSSAVRYLGDNLIPGLGIHTRPPYELVISHVKNISGRFPASRNEEIPSTLHATLLDAMQKIYRYFMDSCNTTSGPSDTTCSPNCQLIRNSLRNVPVILVDSHTFVCGGQLAFKGVWNNLKPYMFEVPRNFQQYDHFLKCLGAQERPTPLQYATVLETIKKSCVDNKMHPGEVRAAVAATKCLFVRLSKTKKRSQTRGHSAPSTAQSLANVQTLYLPTEDDYLKPSGEVFVNDTMEKKERLKDYWKELLIDLTMKDQERPAKLVELLPNHLRVKKLSSILNEELSPSCIDQICVADQDPIASSCEFIKRYRNVICSREFSEALIRLYKAQEDTPSVPEEVINDLRCLENRVKVSCMQTIAVRLVKIATMEPVSGSNKEVPCFYHETPDEFRILIKHGGETNPGVLHERLSSFIAWITGQHIKEAYWRYLMMILGVEDAIQISMTLDEARVTSNSGDNREPKLGDKIPECYHDLLKHNIKFYLRDGEWVGYEVREEDEENEAVYVYAKIIEKTCPGIYVVSFQ